MLIFVDCVCILRYLTASICPGNLMYTCVTDSIYNLIIIIIIKGNKCLWYRTVINLFLINNYYYIIIVIIWRGNSTNSFDSLWTCIPHEMLVNVLHFDQSCWSVHWPVRVILFSWSCSRCLVSWSCRIHQLLFCRRERLNPKVRPGYDSKQSDGEVPVMLELWGMRSSPSLPLLWPGVEVLDGVLPIAQIELNCVLMLNWIVWNWTFFDIETMYLC